VTFLQLVLCLSFLYISFFSHAIICCAQDKASAWHKDLFALVYDEPLIAQAPAV
jgi:hypothetical protein